MGACGPPTFTNSKIYDWNRGSFPRCELFVASGFNSRSAAYSIISEENNEYNNI